MRTPSAPGPSPLALSKQYFKFFIFMTTPQMHVCRYNVLFCVSPMCSGTCRRWVAVMQQQQTDRNDC